MKKLRRNLQQFVLQLQGSDLVLSVPLRRDFAREPAYWVEIYKVSNINGRKVPPIYYAIRQWGFRRKDEIVQSNGGYIQCTSFESALADAKRTIEVKTTASGGWIVCEPSCMPLPVVQTSKEARLADVFVSDLMSAAPKISGATKVEVTSRKEKKVTRADKFKAAQLRRRSKAEW